MSDERGFGARWRDYRPSKLIWFWSCIGSIALTLILGFSWGGWVTGSTAREMAEETAAEARAELAATICVERFQSASDAAAQLAALQEESTWQRDDFIEEGGWATPRGVSEPVPDAASLCAERLIEFATESAEQVPAES